MNIEAYLDVVALNESEATATFTVTKGARELSFGKRYRLIAVKDTYDDEDDDSKHGRVCTVSTQASVGTREELLCLKSEVAILKATLHNAGIAGV